MIYKKLDLPKIPKELLVYDRQLVSKVDSGYGLDHYKDGRKLTACEYVYARLLHQPLREWVKEQLGMTAMPRMAVQFQKVPEGATEATHIVHSDIMRNWCLNYIIDTGGLARTSWYHERGQPLNRYRQVGQHQQTDTGPVDYANLDMLDSVICEPETWYLIPLTILHDVDHITSHRWGITVSFDDLTDIKPEFQIP
jgi:hypothetical protein